MRLKLLINLGNQNRKESAFRVWCLWFGVCLLAVSVVIFFSAYLLAQEAKTGPKQEELQIEPEQTSQQGPQETAFIPKPDIEFGLDIKAKTIPLPRIFSASIDLSGRGFHRDETWPYHIAAHQAIEEWQKGPGFKKGIYRLRWNLWELNLHGKNKKPTQGQAFANYETIIKNISDAGGIIILSLYGTPPGFGRALDKRSPPSNFKQWRLLVTDTVRYLSCEKKYNIWYEVWDAPDIDDFFLGLKKDYFNLYRFTSLAVQELRRKYKMNIPMGGPAVTWWFQNFDGNSILTPEKSLIYELIKFCSHYKLPLDFISWHAYSTDPYAEKEVTAYKKTASELIRDWLSFFRLNKNIPLVIDEWNYDSGSNILEERGNKSYVCASYIPSRLKNMFKAGIDYQTFFSLEDFQNEKGKIDNNRGIFSYDPESSKETTQRKSIYNIFLMLGLLGENLFKNSDIDSEFLNLLATKKKNDIIILIWNYIDPYIELSFLSRNITSLSEKDHTGLLGIIKEDKLIKLINGELSIDGLSASNKLKGLLRKTAELKIRSLGLLNKPINIKITLAGIKGDYLYQRYAIDNSCVLDCPFVPVEEKELINLDAEYQQILALNPYSVHLIILKEKTPVSEIEK